MDFKEKLSHYQNIVNEELKKCIDNEECPEKVLNQAKEYSLMAGGKRLRPILIMATYKLFKEDVEKTYKYAAAMEMIHTFSLIHDDLPGIDNDDYRRGKLTNHKKFNEATAILAGDGLLNGAYKFLLEDIKNEKDETQRTNKINALCEMSYGTDRMIAGEFVDTAFEGKDISKDCLEYMHKNKTGALIRASVKIGAILAGAGEEEIKKLDLYAEKIGLAFQIKDDILSEVGDQHLLGKPVGNDREMGKCTYVTIYGLENSKKMLDNIIDEAIEIVNKYDKNQDFFIELALYIKNRNK